MQNFFNRSKYGIILVSILFWCVTATATAFAIENKKINTTIDQKRRHSIITTLPDETAGPQKWIMTVHAAGQKYHILDNTVIVGLAGEALTMDKLAVPCEVEVTYSQMNKGSRNALLITVKNELSGASAFWPVALPE